MRNPGEVTVALQRLTHELRSRIQGLPDHPWVPGGRFADGALITALEDAEAALEMYGPQPVTVAERSGKES